jgi:hypothetical protein
MLAELKILQSYRIIPKGGHQIWKKNKPFDHGIQDAELDFLLSRISGPEQNKYRKYYYSQGRSQQ